MRRRNIGIAAAVVIVVLGTLFAVRRDRGGMTVDTQPVARRATFRSFVTASGQVVAQRFADIGSSVMGRLVELRVKEGDVVKAGLVPVAELDAARAAADTANAQLNSSQAALRRMQQGREATDRRLAETRADAARVGDLLARTEIPAPLGGTVTRLPVQEGEMVVMEAIPGVSFTGRVVEIGASALPVVGTGAAAREFKVKVRLDSPNRQLPPGLTCDAEILTAERQGVLAVPLQAVVIRPGKDGQDQPGVFVAEGRIVRFRPVTTSLIGGLDIEVTGLNDGTPVVTGPFQALRELKDGQAVRAQVPR
jgi:HlyD family secretion protein